MGFPEYFPIWDKLTQAHKDRLLEMSVLQKFKAGDILHDGGANCLGLLLVRTGQLRAYLLSDEGREVTICRFFEMDLCLFSAACVMPNMQFNIFVEAEKDSEIWIIPACLYQNLMDESLVLSNYSHNLITNHFSDVMWLMEQIMWKSFDKRLAEFLLNESNLEDTNCLKITHEKIANHLGTAREVVTRMLCYFQSEGMVALTRGAVEITDVKQLSKLRDK